MAVSFRLAQHLSEQERNKILKLLKAADHEFIPPLSARTGTTQQDLEHAAANADGVAAYFSQMSQQTFILAEQRRSVCGFLSFIPDYHLTAGDLDLQCDYISTVIVSPAHRSKGITTGMYQTLFRTFPAHILATRTWSTNTAHLHILKKLGFRLALTLRNDRGNNIDTVYYVKGDSHEEALCLAAAESV